MKSEAVLCIPATFPPEGKTGFIPKEDVGATALFALENLWFIPRTDCEDDPGFKQVVTYLLVRNSDHVARSTRITKSS